MPHDVLCVLEKGKPESCDPFWIIYGLKYCKLKFKCPFQVYLWVSLPFIGRSLSFLCVRSIFISRWNIFVKGIVHSFEIWKRFWCWTKILLSEITVWQEFIVKESSFSCWRKGVFLGETNRSENLFSINSTAVKIRLVISIFLRMNCSSNLFTRYTATVVSCKIDI